MKKTLKKILKSIGYTVVKNNHYNKILKNNKQVNSSHSYGVFFYQEFFSLLERINYQPRIIYDIGANKGLWTKECLRYFPEAIYYLFEPQVGLKKHIDVILVKHQNVQLFSVGLGNVNDKMNFTIHDRDDSCSYSFTEKEAKKRGFNQVLLPIYRLESFVKDHGLKNPDILKIDAEGLDLKVLEGAENLLQYVEIIFVEVAIMNPRLENTTLRMLNYLDEKGFKLFDITHLNRPFANQVLWLCEFVFIRKGCVLDKNYLKV